VFVEFRSQGYPAGQHSCCTVRNSDIGFAAVRFEPPSKAIAEPTIAKQAKLIADTIPVLTMKPSWVWTSPAIRETIPF
jgi:hypothetical protein